MRHIGVQHDGTVRQVIGEANMLDDNFPEHKNEVFPMGLVGELDDKVTSGPVGLQVFVCACVCVSICVCVCILIYSFCIANACLNCMYMSYAVKYNTILIFVYLEQGCKY